MLFRSTITSPQNNGKEYIVEEGLAVGDVIVAEGAGLIKEGTEIKSRPAPVENADTTAKVEEVK